MARDDSLTLVNVLKDLFADLSDLVKKEVRLARAEMTEAVKGGLQAGLWMGVGGVLAFIAALVLLQAIIFGLASLGLGLGWAALIVAVALGALAAIAFFYGRSLARGSLKPDRALRQINRDVAAVREQLT
jgi:hypothetical protein